MVAWAWLDPAQGREQAGRRPVLIVANDGYLDIVEDLAIVMPITPTDRSWPNHVPLSPAALLPVPSWIMTEQVRTISRRRIQRQLGPAAPQCMANVLHWLTNFTR
jgi:mRNA interferase MazF